MTPYMHGYPGLLALAVICCLTLIMPPVYAGADDGVHAREEFSGLNKLMQRAERDPAQARQLTQVIIEDAPDSDLRNVATAVGGTVRYHVGGRHQIALPAGNIRQLIARLPPGSKARLSYPYSLHQVTSQGVVPTGAADMHALGNTGAGIKVGVIDVGFNGYTAAQASGDLPASLTITDYTGTGTGGEKHGTAVAEIVHDMAPGAQLYLAKISTDVELQQATTDMLLAGVKVINHSVGWYAAAFYDGTGPICNTVDQAEAGGAVWVNSMGNSRRQHYLGMFSDTNADLRHEFATGQNYNTVVSIPAGTWITLILNWDAYPTTSIDYNMYLYNGDPDNGGTLVAESTTRQRPSDNPYPVESIDYQAATTATYYVVVKKANSSTANVRLTLFSLVGSLGAMSTNSSLNQPADCSYVVSTGAVRVATDVPESFSSEGPTTDGRLKPDVSAPNFVTTTQYGSFSGTSAASPHVAGAVALLRAQNPGMTAAQIRALLTTTVEDVHTAGFDARTGYGRISFDADADGHNHDHDNCPLIANSAQDDLDGDGEGDACDLDIDGDGLDNVQEASLGTDPYLEDTDGDGLGDGDEVNVYATDALLFDTDGDGLGDGDEVLVYASNPLVSDKGDVAPQGAANGMIDLADILVLIRYVEGLAIPDARDQVLGDINDDGVLDVRDVLLLHNSLGY